MYNHKKPYYLHLKELLKLLQARGVRIDIDHYQSLKVIFDAYGASLTPEEMATKICPILVNDAEQQAHFYRVFAECVQQIEQEVTPTQQLLVKKEQSLPNLHKQQRLFLMLFVLFLTAFSSIIWLTQENFVQRKSFIDLTKELPTTKKSSEKALLFEDHVREGEAKNSGSIREELEDIVHLNIEEAKKLSYLPLEFEDMAENEVEVLWWQEHKMLVKWWFAGTILLVFLLIEAYHFSKNKLIAKQRKQIDKDATLFDLSLPQQYAVQYPMQALHKLAYQLRGRVSTAESKRIDIGKTVDKTIQNAGVVDLVYQAPTKVPQYLILIDQSAKRNQKWSLFEFITKELVRQDLSVERYYFNEIPNKCWNESTHEEVSLKYLQKHFPSHRLIIFGLADHFTSDKAEELMVLSSLKQWDESVFMTIKPKALWGIAENALGAVFQQLLTADWMGFEQAVERFNLIETTELKNLNEVEEQIVIDFDAEVEEVVANMLFYLLPHDVKPVEEEANLMTWIAACCLLPSIQWDTTLFIGGFLSSKDNYLLTVDNLTRLAKLKWFQDGEIPEKFRSRLLFDETLITKSQLEALANRLGQVLAQAIDEQAEHDKFLSAKMSVLAINCLSNKPDKQRRKAANQLKKLWPFLEKKDWLVFEVMEQFNTSNLDLLIPKKLRAFFFNDPFSFSGIRPSVRMGIAAVMLLLPFLFIRGEFFCNYPVAYENKNYCIVDTYEKAQMMNYMAVKSYDSNQADASQTMRALIGAASMRPGYATCKENLVKVQYNQLVYHAQNNNLKRAWEYYQNLQSNPKAAVVIGEDVLQKLELK